MQTTSGNAYRIFRIFLFGGFCILMITFSLYWSAEVVWTDFIHFNPNRTFREMWVTLLGSPFICLVMVLTNWSFVLLAVSTTAALGYKTLHRLPFWYLFILLLVCASSLYYQREYNNPSWGEEMSWMSFTEWLTPHVLLYLFGCWWLSRRIQLTTPQLSTKI